MVRILKLNVISQFAHPTKLVTCLKSTQVAMNDLIGTDFKLRGKPK